MSAVLAHSRRPAHAVVVPESPGEPADSMVKRLKKKPTNAGIWRAMKARQYARSKGQKRRDKHVRAMRLARKRAKVAAAWDARHAAAGR